MVALSYSDAHWASWETPLLWNRSDTSRFGANADVRELLWQAYVYAAAYQLYLTDKALLQAKVKEWIQEFEENEEIKKLEED